MIVRAAVPLFHGPWSNTDSGPSPTATCGQSPGVAPRPTMQTRAKTTALVGAVAVLVAVVVFFTLGGDPAPPPDSVADRTAGAGADVVSGELGAKPAAVTGEARDGVREQVAGGTAETGVRGIVLSAANGLPLGGIEVIAVKDEPSIEPLVARFRGLFQQGLFVETRAPRRELGRTDLTPATLATRLETYVAALLARYGDA